MNALLIVQSVIESSTMGGYSSNDKYCRERERERERDDNVSISIMKLYRMTENRFLCCFRVL